MSVYANLPALPFSGFRGAVYQACLLSPGRFVEVPEAVGRGFNATTAAKKINLRLQRLGLPYEVRTLGAAKAPTHVGVFVAGAIGEGRVSRDSRSGQARTAANLSVDLFGKERIVPTLATYAERRSEIAEARAAATDAAKAAALQEALNAVFGEPVAE